MSSDGTPAVLATGLLDLPIETAPFRRWVCFRLADADYGVDIQQVREVLAEVRVEPVPGALPEIEGVSNLRGEIVTLLDLRAWLGQPPAEVEGAVLILSVSGLTLGLRVDAIGELLNLPLTAMEPPRPVGTARLDGLVCGHAGVLTLLDFETLLVPLPTTAEGPRPHRSSLAG